MRPPRLLSAMLAFALLGAAACGDDDEGGGGDDGGLSSEEQAYADAWAVSLSDSEDGLSVSAEDADCMATAIMAELGVEPFEEAEVEPADIESGDDSPGEMLGAGTVTDEQADAILDRWEDCVDIAAVLAEAAVGEFELDEEGQQCVADGLREDDLARAGLKPSFTSDETDPPTEVLTAVATLLDECSAGSDGEGGGAIVDGIARSLAADGSLTEEQSECVAQAMVDIIGIDRLIELGAGGGDLENLDPEVQQQIGTAVLDAAESCGIPLSELGG